MINRNKTKLTTAYRKYRKAKVKKQGLLHFMRSFMSEIIFRTTKLEGERVSRRTVNALFK